jgi:DNA-binding MarR family transcriptional regulator
MNDKQPQAGGAETEARASRREAFLRHILAVRNQEKRGALGSGIIPRDARAAKLYGAGEAHVSDILYYLALSEVSGEPCTMGDVNVGAGVPRSSAHRLIAQLVKDGVVVKERSTEDRRFTRLRLAPEFRASFMARVDTIMADTGFTFLDDLGTAEAPDADASAEDRAEYVDREIRDALNVVSGFAELLLDPVFGLNSQSPHRAHVETILRAAKHLDARRQTIAENLLSDRMPASNK